MYKVVVVRYNETGEYGGFPRLDLAPFKRQVCFDLLIKGGSTSPTADVFEGAEDDEE